jgi:dTMP kinase
VTQKVSASGFFIVFEGGEGTGKTTQIHKLKDWIENSFRRKALVTFEPGGTPLGQKIREYLLDPSIPKMDERCEVLLFAAARAEHVAKVIRPALQAGQVVLCDRYWDASRAYQGGGRQLGFQPIDRINSFGTRGLRPDRVFLFDHDPAAGLERARKRNHGVMDRLEQEALAYHERVRESYLEIARRQPSVFRILDARLGIDEIFSKLQEDLETCLPKN